MSDVIVSTTESTTDVTTTNDVTTVAITNTVVEISQATAGLQGVPGSNSDPTYVFVTNKTGAQLNKGSIVYVSGANGTHTQVSLALATGDVTSARTLGWLAEDIANNATGLCCVEGYLDGINTQGVTEGAQLYLSPTTPGAFTETKPSAPDHMVYVGICAKASSGNGRVFVHVQNGAELEELHDVKIVSPQNNDLLRYVSGTALWENVASTAVSVGSAIVAGTSVYATNAGTSVYASTAGTSVYATNAGTAVDLSGSITKSQVSDFTSGTVASASTAQQAGTAVYATTSGSASVAGSAVAYTGSITISQITDLANATVTSASTAQQAGTAVYALTSGTADYATTSGTSVYATTSGTAVTITGSITRSQVSDFASGTVANISGTVTQAQVSGLGTALAGKAGLADNNTFTGTNTFSNFTTFQAASDAIPIRIFGANGQSADLFSINDYLTNTQFEILSDGRAQSLKGIIATVSGTASIPLVVRGTAGQSANLLEIQNSGSTAIATVSPLGYGNFTRVTAGSTADLGYAVLSVNTGATATMGLVVRGVASQGTPFIDIQNNVGNSLFRVNNSGFAAAAFGIIGGGSAQASGANNTLYSTGTASVGLVVRGASGQTANLQEWQSNTGGTAARVNSTGSIITSQGFAVLGGASISGSIATLLQTSNSARIPLVVQGAASQSANLQEWQTSSGSTAARVDASGYIYSPFFDSVVTNAGLPAFRTRLASGQTGDSLQIMNNAAQSLAGFTSTGRIVTGIAASGFTPLTSASLGQVTVFPASTATVGVVVQGLSGQSANAFEYQNSSGGTVFSIGASSGFITSSGGANFNSALMQIGAANSGGQVTWAKQTAVATNPGANAARLYFRDGTNAGTLKLVVRAGTAGAETTILDNIPQS